MYSPSFRIFIYVRICIFFNLSFLVARLGLSSTGKECAYFCCVKPALSVDQLSKAVPPGMQIAVTFTGNCSHCQIWRGAWSKCEASPLSEMMVLWENEMAGRIVHFFSRDFAACNALFVCVWCFFMMTVQICGIRFHRLVSRLSYES